MIINVHFNIYEQDKFHFSWFEHDKKSYMTSGQVSRDCSSSVMILFLEEGAVLCTVCGYRTWGGGSSYYTVTCIIKIVTSKAGHLMW